MTIQLGIFLIFAALILGVCIGGYARSTKMREGAFRRAIRRYLIDEERRRGRVW